LPLGAGIEIESTMKSYEKDGLIVVLSHLGQDRLINSVGPVLSNNTLHLVLEDDPDYGSAL
jgi:hypothetical protein